MRQRSNITTYLGTVFHSAFVCGPESSRFATEVHPLSGLVPSVVLSACVGVNSTGVVDSEVVVVAA